MAKYVILAAAQNVMEKVEGYDRPQPIRHLRGEVLDLSQADVDRLLPHGGIAAEDSEAGKAAKAEREAVNTPIPSPQDDVVPVAAPVPSPTPDGTGAAVSTSDTPQGSGVATGKPRDYSALSYPELQAEAKSRNINAGGSAAEIIERLQEADEDASGPA